MSDHFNDNSSASPRAFVTATGFIFQTVGFLLSLGGCCFWSLSGLFQPEVDRSMGELTNSLQFRDWMQLLSALDVVTSFVCGLGLIACGLGLQAEKRRSGLWAMGVAGLWVLVWWTSLVSFLISFDSLMRCLIALVFSLGATVLFLMSVNCHRLLKKYPPTDEFQVVDDEFLRQYKRRSDE